MKIEKPKIIIIKNLWWCVRCLSVCVFVCLFCLYVYLFVCFNCMCICLHVYLFVSFVCMCICLFVLFVWVTVRCGNGIGCNNLFYSHDAKRWIIQDGWNKNLYFLRHSNQWVGIYGFIQTMNWRMCQWKFYFKGLTFSIELVVF
jgi:hypothetical protein